MAEISASMVMDLRQRTGLGMMECKKALTEAGGDLARAEELLRIKSGAKASKAAGRVGVTVEVDADEATGKDIALHVAATAAPGNVRPVCVSRTEVPVDLIEKERAIYAAQAADTGKPPEIVAKMVEGRINKFLAEVTLHGQPFVKDLDQTVEKYLKSKGATVKSFALYVVGEGIEKKKDDFAAEVAAMAKA